MGPIRSSVYFLKIFLIECHRSLEPDFLALEAWWDDPAVAAGTGATWDEAGASKLVAAEVLTVDPVPEADEDAGVPADVEEDDLAGDDAEAVEDDPLAGVVAAWAVPCPDATIGTAELDDETTADPVPEAGDAAGEPTWRGRDSAAELVEAGVVDDAAPPEASDDSAAM